MAVGLLALTVTNLTVHLPFKQAHDRASLALVQSYLATGDADAFTHDPFYEKIHPNPSIVREVLDDPLLRPRLPAALRSSSAQLPWIIAHGSTLTIFATVLLVLTLSLSAHSTAQIGLARR
jgi:hypothetical protein